MALGHAKEPDYPDYGQEPSQHWIKRGIGFGIDSLVAVGFAVGVLCILTGVFNYIDALDLMVELIISIAVSVVLFFLLMFLYPALMEILIQRSLGKVIMSYIVVPTEEEAEEDEIPALSPVQAIMRNIIKITIVAPIIGGVLSMGKEEGWRQRGIVGDDMAKTEVIPYFGPRIVHVRKKAFMPSEMEDEEEGMDEELERDDLPFPEELLRGECPRCGTPYRIMPDGFSGWDGLWNYRCVWCNYAVLESYNTDRIRPGFE